MLTFFTTAKPFQGHDGMIQRNALISWKLLHRDVEVIVFGDEPGVAEICNELGLQHEPGVKRHESGMKYLDYMFARAAEISRHSLMCYSNCDIVQLQEFRVAIERSLQWRDKFLMVSRRWDTDVLQPINFTAQNWHRDLQQLALKTGFHQIPLFVDFFVFRKGMYPEVPPLLVGRSYWDHWLVWNALNQGAPVLDCSSFIVPVHQNHGYGYHPQGKQGTNEDALALRNIELCGAGKHLRSILDATHKMLNSGKIIRFPFNRELYFLQQITTKQGLLNYTFGLRKRLGLRKASAKKLRTWVTGADRPE